MPKRIRPIISLLLLVIALAIGVHYIAGHKELLHQLGQTPFLVNLAVFMLYVLMFFVLILIFEASLIICGKRIGWFENGLLNAHSLFINFFVPGQGGPAYRGVYLYRKHSVKVKNYIVVTLLYYAIYAVINVIMLLAASQPWWQTTLGALAAALFSWLVINFYTKRNRSKIDALNITPRTIVYLVLATVLQAAVQLTIYGVELHSVNSSIHFSQMVTYTGAANLALFVSLTPGAIGIRETFLIFTRHLHHISSANIIVANVIDRSVYLVFLLTLLVLTAAWHIKNKEDPFKL